MALPQVPFGQLLMGAPLFLTPVLLLITFAAWKYIQYVNFKARYKFPNPVPGLPVLGNSLQMPSTGQGPFLEQLARKHGEM